MLHLGGKIMISDNSKVCRYWSERKMIIVGEEGKCVQVCMYKMKERELLISSRLQKKTGDLIVVTITLQKCLKQRKLVQQV